MAGGREQNIGGIDAANKAQHNFGTNDAVFGNVEDDIVGVHKQLGSNHGFQLIVDDAAEADNRHAIQCITCIVFRPVGDLIAKNLFGAGDVFQGRRADGGADFFQNDGMFRIGLPGRGLCRGGGSLSRRRRRCRAFLSESQSAAKTHQESRCKSDNPIHNMSP